MISASPSSHSKSDTSVIGQLARSVVLCLLPLIPLAITTWLAMQFEKIVSGETLTFEIAWVPSLGIEASFFLDAFSLTFALLVSGIGTLVMLYATSYMTGDLRKWRLFGWLMLFLFAMLGLVTADNIIVLFVFWELTSISSYFLIGHKHEDATARASALQALLVTGTGGLAMLAGLILVAMATGTDQLTEILDQPELIRQSPFVTGMAALLLLGAFTKSAQFPFHFWLPDAMSAPTPVSAYLHSATMVKAGVYLVARLSPAFAGVPFWDFSVIIAGTVTALLGGFLAWQQTDLKRILAFSTISALGTLMLLLGLGTTYAVQAAVLFLVAHSFYKGTLFLVAGAVDHTCGTRDITRLGGLMRHVPGLGLAAILAGVSLAGVPPAAGFLAKEFVLKASLGSDWPELLTAVVFLISLFFVMVAGLVVIKPFFGSSESLPQMLHRPDARLVLPPLFLGIAGMAAGLLANVYGKPIVAGAMAAISPDVKIKSLALWQGWNLPLMLSLVALVSGGVLYAVRQPMISLFAPLTRFCVVFPTDVYRASLAGLNSMTRWQSHLLQDGRLRVYLLVVLITLCSLVAGTLNVVNLPTEASWLPLKPYEMMMPFLILCATLMAIRAKSRMAAICALGVIGYAIALIFVIFGAPDLAMTQLAIETLTVLLFVFVIYRMPRFATLSGRKSRVRDAIVAIIAGGLMSVIALVASMSHVPSRVSEFYANNSYTVAQGRNLVNVILVDFRGLDTMAEVTVLSIAALGIVALMRLQFRSVSDSTDSVKEEDAEVKDDMDNTKADTESVERLTHDSHIDNDSDISKRNP